MTFQSHPVAALPKALFRQRFRTMLLAPDGPSLQVEVRDYVTPQMGAVGLDGLRQFDAAGPWTGPVTSMSLTEFRAGFAEVVGEVVAGKVVRLTSKDAEVGALLPLPQFRALADRGPGAESSVAAAVTDGALPASSRPVVLTLWNEAGGVGKTSLVAELAAVLSSMKNPDGSSPKVLVIDLDPQRSLTARMGLLGGENNEAEKLKNSLHTILQDPLGDLPQPFHAQGLPGIDVIPGHRLLRHLEGRMTRDDFRRLGVALRNADWDYDFLIFDTPPSNGDLTRAALCASDYAVIPTPCHVKGLLNLDNVGEVLKECREIRPELHLLAFAPVAYGKGRTHDREILQLLQTAYAEVAPCTRPITDRPAVYRNVIPLCSAVIRDQPRSAAADELREVTTQLLELIAVHQAARA